MKISFADQTLPQSGVLAVGIWADGKLTDAAADVDKRTDGLIARALAAAGRFSGKREQLLPIVGPVGIGVSRLILVGLGDPGKLDELALQRVGGTLQAHLNQTGMTEATVLLGALEGAAVPAATAAAELAFGALLRSYRFDKYRTKPKGEQKPTLDKLTFALVDKATAKKLFGRHEKIAEGVFLTRDLLSEPANMLYPESFAERCQELSELGIEVEVLDEKKMRKLGMGALLGVGQGSERESRLVVMHWKGGKDKDQPIAFVGKGVTFDTGGISIKPAQGMWDMKWDMGGAGVVTGLMKALAGRKAKVNAVGVVGLVENMPSGNAQRPGDVVTSLSGQTIEVLNTDAEGRLVLADALWYTQDRFKPKFMVDLATLTGAIIISLGKLNAGLFSNDDDLAGKLAAAGKAVDETVWRMPLGDAYDKQIDSDIADVKNIAGHRDGGSIIAAQFLQRFVNGTPWAHLDIAGMVWSSKDAPTAPKGGTGYGVRLLDRLVADNYEG
ncbi:MAG TPA: leucyl aminopeptidase [Alphaproteobacteria bacterium]|nr:leucyl aminopeptidase [Alphaproteobacteria bacterium]